MELERLPRLFRTPMASNHIAMQVVALRMQSGHTTAIHESWPCGASHNECLRAFTSDKDNIACTRHLDLYLVSVYVRRCRPEADSTLVCHYHDGLLHKL
jgi:hypothetical protein